MSIDTSERIENKVISVLVFANNRLNLLKRLTIPCSELMTALIGARSVKFVAKQLELQVPVIV
ncbi:unnamed protein product [Enterobius vermicularis]|uniref:MarR family transcriptional regulator n=1 Tax=Enterobius vermicularis TaxID=51028 RepID=A0A158QBB7_ENTVE|nr:unnamed protein product [Enterobius vermicularis]